MSVTGPVSAEPDVPLANTWFAVPVIEATEPPVVARVPEVGKVTSVAPVILKIEAKAPTVVRLPPKVRVEEPLLTPVPPLAEGTMPMREMVMVFVVLSPVVVKSVPSPLTKIVPEPLGPTMIASFPERESTALLGPPVGSKRFRFPILGIPVLYKLHR